VIRVLVALPVEIEVVLFERLTLPIGADAKDLVAGRGGGNPSEPLVLTDFEGREARKF